MPIYIFVCETCKQELESIEKHSTTTIICTKCGNKALRDKRPLKNTFHLKGAGWYGSKP